MRVTLSFFIVFAGIICSAYSQSFQTIDTLYHGKHFNTLQYYQRQDLRMIGNQSEKTFYALGNYADSLKNGTWLFFYPDGRRFAKGHYKNGVKRGNWVYHKDYSGAKKYKVNYAKNTRLKESIYLNQYGYLCIVDAVWKDEGRIVEYTNGLAPPLSCIRGLED